MSLETKKRKAHEKGWKAIAEEYGKNVATDARDDASHDLARTLEYYRPIHAVVQRVLGNTLRGKKVLHLGSGMGIYTDYLQRQGVHAVALDVDHEYMHAARAIGNRRVIRANATRTFPIKDESVDVVLSDHFLFSNYAPLHNEDWNIIKSVSRALKPGGYFILSRFIRQMMGDEVMAARLLMNDFRVVPTSEYGIMFDGMVLQKETRGMRKKREKWEEQNKRKK